MITSYTIISLPFSSLSYSSTWDMHPFLASDKPVRDSVSSISRVGLLHPPLVQKVDKNNFACLSHWRSLNVLNSEGSTDEIPCRRLPDNCPPATLLELLAEEHGGTEGLTPIEKAVWSEKVWRYVEDKQEREELLGRYGLPLHPGGSKRLSQLLELDGPYQAAIQDGFLNEATARDLLKLTVQDRRTLFDLFTKLEIGSGKQRRLLALLRDLAGREGVTIEEILHKDDVASILVHREKNRPQSAAALLHLLGQLHSPGLHAAETEFNRWQSSLSLPDNFTVRHGKSFETEEIHLEISFANSRELAAKMNELADIAGINKENG